MSKNYCPLSLTSSHTPLPLCLQCVSRFPRNKPNPPSIPIPPISPTPPIRPIPISPVCVAVPPRQPRASPLRNENLEIRNQIRPSNPQMPSCAERQSHRIIFVLWDRCLSPVPPVLFNPSNTQSAPHTLRPYVYKRKHLFPSAQTF